MTDGQNRSTDLRALALEYLLELESGKSLSHVALSGMLEKYQYLNKQERAFLTRLAEGTVERMLTLDYVLDQFSKTPVKKMKPVIRNLLRLSVYQLLFMDSVPDSAACNEAVKLAQKKGFTNLKGYVNGILRNISRKKQGLVYPSLSVQYSTPEWIVEQWISEYGEETAGRLLEEQYLSRPLTVRVNTLRTTKEALKARLMEEGAEVQDIPELDFALAVSGFDHLRALPSFREGFFQIQDVSSMRVALTAAPRPGDYCIDVCAAPGGKSLHLAELMGGTGMVEARDLTEYKVGLLEENIRRSRTENIRAVRMDATVFDEASVEKADVLLADLPCSGLGVLSKKRDLKYRMSPGQQQELVALQRKILDTVWRYVKPGGVLVYSTCTVHKEENEGNARWFAGNYPFVLEKELQILPEAEKEGSLPTDFFYIARFKRKRDD